MSENIEQNKNQYNEKLIDELVSNRKELSGILVKVREFRNSIEKLIPTSNEYKNRYILEQKIKTITEVIKSELEIRKQIDNSIKNEFDLRKKYLEDDDKDNIDLSKLAMLLEDSQYDIDEDDEDSFDDDVTPPLNEKNISNIDSQEIEHPYSNINSE